MCLYGVALLGSHETHSSNRAPALHCEECFQFVDTLARPAVYDATRARGVAQGLRKPWGLPYVELKLAALREANLYFALVQSILTPRSRGTQPRNRFEYQASVGVCLRLYPLDARVDNLRKRN